ncbi:hydroxyisourate hydrolase [Paraneptunicella aestuarii]|uniref:hydroxyisourate hydrolase n=1 Tax=Paraneptunicella aestuarii TaxID=2831148 RepID=UPI001E539971|nr:hydroxyisourate hydrolase [Paraneptunicella aestuarii]UAA37133.1 hydroxyisourate hydrolase [Paraneptunicella aestuarii]
MITLSSHVLDTTKGTPAANMALCLTTPDGKQITASTDNDGRCKNWGDIEFTPGIYCIRFEAGEYLKAEHGKSFYPFVDIHFEMQEDGGHYHVPLLVSPFGYSSYRGS